MSNIVIETCLLFILLFLNRVATFGPTIPPPRIISCNGTQLAINETIYNWLVVMYIIYIYIIYIYIYIYISLFFVMQSLYAL